MSKFTDQQYLTTDQYKDARNLDARLEIHHRFSNNPYGWFNWIFDTLVQLPKDANVLELGSGSGALWTNIADRIPANWKITLSDLSQGMLDAAWRNLVVTGRNFKFEKIDAQSIPYEDETFDIIIANHMLYHVPDRPRALAEIKRVLKDDGRLIATTVGEDHIKEMLGWIRRASMEKEDGRPSQPFTLQNGLGQLQVFFSKVDMERYMDGLRVTEIAPIMAYIRSSIRAAGVSEDQLELIERELASILEKEGEIFITKDSGLFKALK
ncbi:MAG TPA: methyltransferase domain-containing protein [Anaerolineales bacterium]|nr:methyltransferase domain-containing protein [Anaerolineales bacterium]